MALLRIGYAKENPRKQGRGSQKINKVLVMAESKEVKGKTTELPPVELRLKDLELRVWQKIDKQPK